MHGQCGLFFTSYAREAQIFQSRFQKTAMALFFAALVGVVPFLNTYHVSVLCLINIAVVGAVALNILTGRCGQISLGHGAFLGVGAYASAALTGMGLPFVLAMPAAGLVTACVGMIFGLPSLRLKGIYLAIATLAAQLILEYVFLHLDAVTGGSNGLSVDPPSIAGFAFDSDLKMFYLTLGVATLAVLMAANLMRTRPGRAFTAIRDHHLSAEIVGINLFAWKLAAFGMSSFLAGVAGSLWAHYTMYITPEQFNIGLSVSYLAMIIIGGMGSVLGSVFGAVFLTVLPEAINFAAQHAGQTFAGVADYLLAMKAGVFGLVLVLFLIFEPEGLARRWRLIKAYWKLYPFAY
ncbi:MAG: branched-chain amino acid ABC transporter permease [Desulfovibrio sp.]|nr:branched-chain amino acid ABC transporter permease [Desulfovibrio sp.]